MKKIFIYASACERRELDATRIKKYFEKNGHKIVWKPNQADIIIIVTCDLLEKIRDFNLKKIKEFQEYKAEVIVAGCVPDISKEKLKGVFNGRTISTKDLNENPDKINRLFPENKIPFEDIEDSNYLFPPLYDESKSSCVLQKLIRNVNSIQKTIYYIEDFLWSKNDQTNVHWWHPIKKPLYHIRTSWGCPSNCSYCAIKKAIGPLRSKPVNKIMEEFKNGLNRGFKLFFINADDLGSYGIDSGSNLYELLDNILSVKGDYKLVLRSVNPPWLIKYIDEIEEILKKDKIINIEIPIQSGSQRILKLMRRFSDTEKMKSAFKRIKNASSVLKVHTHYIVGFPSETIEDFKMTLDFISETKFKAGTIFPFSLKKNTDAEKIELKISREEVLRWLNNSKQFFAAHGYNTHYRKKPDFFIFYT